MDGNLEILKQEPGRFDAMLTDIVMPVIGGYELVRAVRSGELRSRVWPTRRLSRGVNRGVLA